MTEVHRTRRLAHLGAGALAFCASAFVMLGASPAQAQSVPIEVGGPVVDKVEEVLDDPVGEVEDVVEEAKETVDGVVSDTLEKVDHVSEEVTDVVDETTPDPRPDTPTDAKVSDPPDTQAPATPTAPVDTQGSERERGEQTRVRSEFQTRARTSGISATTERVVLRVPPERDEKPAPLAAADLPLPTVPPATPGEIARRLTFPLLMTAAVVLFLLLQGRFDRRDPKLSFAVCLDRETLSFE